MYKVYIADLGKATGNREIGIRPVISVGLSNGQAEVFKITSRNKTGGKYIRIDAYVVAGFCDVSKSYKIDPKYLLSYKRDCTTGEMQRLDYKRKKLA